MKIVPSIFNNVIGPIMRGPSSSHTAASVRIGRLIVSLLGEEPSEVVFTFDPNGSVASTYRGQGSAMGLAGGLLGMDISDNRLKEAENICREKGITINFRIEEFGADHPNTYKCRARGLSGTEITLTALSTGGGLFRLTELNGEKVEDDLEYLNSLMPVRQKADPVLPFAGIEELMAILKEKGGRLSDFAVEYELAVGDITGEEIDALALSHGAIMRNAIENGLRGTEYTDRIIHRQSDLIRKAAGSGKLIIDSLVNKIIESVSAIMETKSSMGVVCAAPTAGSCGTLGGVIFPVADQSGKTESDISRAIMAAGLFGVFIANEGGFAAEEGGCQYETGAAAGMAAAALTELMGGDGLTALDAGSMALQNVIGLICDPVADRVEVPCLGRNIQASLNALASANMAMAGYDPVIPAGEVIRAMKEVGDSMDHRYRCTCKGGLSVTGSALEVKQRLCGREI